MECAERYILSWGNVPNNPSARRDTLSMSNRILRTTLHQKRLSTAVAELWIVVEVERVTPTTELRGRLSGPKCPGSETVQIAYPLRMLPSTGEALVARILIPEPNLWTAETPFVYEGTVELWQDGELHDRAVVVTGFKMG